MATFSIYISSMEGMCGGGNQYTLDEVCEQISDYRGWKNLGELKKAIRRWAKKATPSTAFMTRYSVIVCTVVTGLPDGECDECLSDNLEYGDLDCVEDGNIQQKIICNECGRTWMDVFMLSERRDLVRNT